MKSIDSEIAKHRLDRNFMTAIAMCDIKLDKKKNRFAVQRRLDIICASINSSDRRDSLMDSLRSISGGCCNIRFVFGEDGVYMSPVVQTPQYAEASGHLARFIIAAAVASASVFLMIMTGGIIV